MKANTSRENRLAFNRFPARYDHGRPTFDLAVVQDLLQRLEVAEDERILEIGPATGQLTAALLACGLRVVAVEPGPQLAAYLQSKSWADQKLHVVCSTFEGFESDEPFAAIVAANSFHWIDPVVGYQKAYELLRPGGRLCLLWTFPILADADLQQRLNEQVFGNDLRDFRRQPEQHMALIRELMAEGRAELVANSRFDQPVEAALLTVTLSWTAEQYIAFQQSQANGGLISAAVAGRIREVLGRGNDVLLDNYIAVTIARK